MLWHENECISYGISNAIVYMNSFREPSWDIIQNEKNKEPSWIQMAPIISHGVAWNGITGLTEKPTVGETVKKYANNGLYLQIQGYEHFSGSIKFLSYPKEFLSALGYGSASAMSGVMINSQKKDSFSLVYRTELSNNGVFNSKKTKMNNEFQLHLIYNATIKNLTKENNTVTENLEAEELSFDFDTVAEPYDKKIKTISDMSKLNSVSHLILDSRYVPRDKMDNIMSILTGDIKTMFIDGAVKRVVFDPYLPNPSHIIRYIETGASIPAPSNTNVYRFGRVRLIDGNAVLKGNKRLFIRSVINDDEA